MRIVSGGQTGVDRAALDAARELGLPSGGWCPRGRRSEDGTIPPEYPLTETPSASYEQRTRWNVRDADATLIIAPLPLSGGTKLTRTVAERLGRPCLVVDPSATDDDAARVAAWLRENGVHALNVAGPRESSHPGIHESAAALLRVVLRSACHE